MYDYVVKYTTMSFSLLFSCRSPSPLSSCPLPLLLFVFPSTSPPFPPFFVRSYVHTFARQSLLLSIPIPLSAWSLRSLAPRCFLWAPAVQLPNPLCRQRAPSAHRSFVSIFVAFLCPSLGCAAILAQGISACAFPCAFPRAMSPCA